MKYNSKWFAPQNSTPCRTQVNFSAGGLQNLSKNDDAQKQKMKTTVENNDEKMQKSRLHLLAPEPTKEL